MDKSKQKVKILSNKKFKAKRRKLGSWIQFIEVCWANATVTGFNSKYCKWLYINKKDILPMLEKIGFNYNNRKS